MHSQIEATRMQQGQVRELLYRLSTFNDALSGPVPIETVKDKSREYPGLIQALSAEQDELTRLISAVHAEMNRLENSFSISTSSSPYPPPPASAGYSLDSGARGKY